MDIQRELSDEERRLVAARLLAEQRSRFRGVQKDAYIAAKVNAATWKRATGALRVRPDRVVEIVMNLWPASQGDWDQVPASGEPGLSESPAATGDRLEILEERIARIEDQLSRLLGDGDAAPVVSLPARPAGPRQTAEAALKAGESSTQKRRRQQDEAGEGPDPEGSEFGA